MRFVLFALVLAACAPPAESPDVQPIDARSDVSDAQALDVADVQPLDVIDDRPSSPMDTGVDTGVAPRDTGVGDTGLPPCTLDPRNCGQCGRVCGEGVLSGRPACAEVATRRWDCVQFCDGFGEGCGFPGGGGVCCASGCGPIDTGCR